MERITQYNSLSSAIQKFIRVRRNFDGNSHQRKYLFNSTCPFTDIEGLRFSTITNSPYDYLSYNPTPEHLFLRDASLESFRRYVSVMFCSNVESEDWSYFKILKKLIPEKFAKITDIVKSSTFRRALPSADFKLPICLIPVIEFYTIESFSMVYGVKSACASLEKTQIRMKLNSYFHALKRLLNCSEGDILDVLVEFGVLPNAEFTLVSTQKDLTVAFSLFRKSSLHESIGKSLMAFEYKGGVVKPYHGLGNENLHQSLVYLFCRHPLYINFQDCLFLDTEIENGGKGRLPTAQPNRKRKYSDNPRDQSNLPKKWRSGHFTDLKTRQHITSTARTLINISESDYEPECTVSLECHPDVTNAYIIDSNDIVSKALILTFPTLLRVKPDMVKGLLE